MDRKDLKKILAGLCVAGLVAAPSYAAAKGSGWTGSKSDAGGVKAKQEAGKSGWTGSSGAGSAEKKPEAKPEKAKSGWTGGSGAGGAEKK